MTDVLVPDIGDFSDVPVIEILVAPGDTVAEEDPLVTLESDKATMEVPSPVAGAVREVKVSVGDRVSEGTLLVTVEPAPLQPDAAGATTAEAGSETAAPPPASPERAPSGGAAPPPTDPEGSAPRSDAAPPADAAPAAPARDGEPVYASPSVRRLARELGVDLSTIDGSGRRGRLTREDVEAAARGPARSAAPAEEARVERVELSRIKKISGPRLTEAWQTIPHVTQHDEADITELEAFRKRINAEQDVKVTMVALLMKACVASLKAHPEVNSSLDGDGLLLKRYYNLGFAADTPQGLLVPVIRDVDRKGLLEIAVELRELSGRARDGKLKGEEMRDATFTISSLGGIGGSFFTPIINPPQVAILGVSKSQTRPVWDGGQFVPRLVVPLSLSYDHRVIDGALAARFVTHLGGMLSDLRRVLL